MFINCNNVSFGYNGHAVISNISFGINEGDYLCIAGENGSGKSTLLKGMAGLISPLRGTIEFAGARGTGYLPQQSAAKKDFPAGVYEIVLSGAAGGLGLRPFYSRAEKERAVENMRRLGISGLKNRCFRELSGGQQRRVLIARALCAAAEPRTGLPCGGRTQTTLPQLLILDEPAAGLDPLVSVELYKLLAALNGEGGMTVIMVSHDIQAAAQYAKHILHIEQGEYFFGSTDEYVHSPFGKKFMNNGGNND
ncbi:MAG: metal ABC transporter ATP-binding protein [Treponema sp.]|jgi:zinc transport system ATP-binding protein|nr:metal ABC transporter ATP-binding protein [Treponema sp.]